MTKIPLKDQIACVDRELSFRVSVYARRVAAGKMKPEAAEREIARMRAVGETLRGLLPKETAQEELGL